MTTHLIFGAGLIGGYMAGCFAAKDLQVSVAGRESMRARFSRELTVTDYLGNKEVVSAIHFVTSDDNQVTHFDFIWLTVKCISLERALEDMAPFVGPQTVILCCQNGLGSDHQVKAFFPGNQVARVIMAANVAQESDTHLHRGSQGDLYIEAYQSEGRNDLAEMVSSNLLKAHTVHDMDAQSWSKLQLNLANSVNALADIPVKKMLEQQAYRKVIALLMKELLAVANAKGLDLPKMAAIPMRWIPIVLNTPNFVFSILGSKMMDIDPTVRTSMWWDLSSSRLTEVDFLNGAVVNHGNRLGLECPANKKIVELIHQIEQSNKRIAFEPELFLKELKK